MKDNRFNFTQERIRKIAKPGQGRVYYYDSSESNLELQVSKTGNKTFYFCGRVHGKPGRIIIGRYPDVSVKTAQERTIAMRLAIAEGRDPREATATSRKKRKAAVTLNEFWEIYVDGYAKEKRENWEQSKKDFDNYFSDLASLHLTEITPDKVHRWHGDLGRDRGHPTADKQVNLLRAVYNKAMKWRDTEGKRYADSNPAVAGYVDRFGGQSRDRYITAKELPATIHAITTHETSGARHFFQLALFTGARKANLLHMAFSDIDMENWIWTIPREQFKGQKGKRHPHPVPLVTQAQEIIQLRRQMILEDWVFPGQRRNGKPLGNADHWWREIRIAASIEDVTIHDLRRTIASWMAMTEASYPIIAQFLGHTLPGATQIYARLAVEPVRERVQIAVDRILEVSGNE